MNPLVTIVIPVLGDTEVIARLFTQLPTTADVEVIIVDGGQDAAALELLTHGRGNARLLPAKAGRAHQMNVGASAAAGEWLLFLHADSLLPPHWLDAFSALPGDIAGGWFRFALDDAAWQARAIERMVAWRVRVFRLPYGDQGLFVRRHIFDAMKGFREMPLLEDVDFATRLVRAGRVIELPLPLRTSSRRWRQDGWLQRSARNVAIVLLYFWGVSPDRLARWYRSGGRG